MARRRSGGAPGLIDRVRWGNLGRLAAVIAACLLFVAAPRGGGPEVPTAGAVEEPLRSQSPVIGERLGPETGGPLLGEGLGRGGERRGRRDRGRPEDGNDDRHREKGGENSKDGNGEQLRTSLQAPPVTPQRAPAAPAPVAPAPPAPEPRRSTGEFF